MLRQIPDLTKNVGTALLLQVAGAGLAFLLNVAIGRLLGASGAGLYFLSLSVISIAAVVARLGLENTVVRFVASLSDEGNWGQVRGVLRYAILRSGGVSLAMALLLIVLSPIFETRIFKAPGLGAVLTATAFAVFTLNVMMLSSEALKGLSRVRNSMLVGGIINPLIGLSCIWPATVWFGSSGAGIAYLCGTATAALTGLFFWHFALKGKEAATVVNSNDMRASSRPLWVSMIVIRALQPWAPLLLLGIWASPADAGIFGAATRIALLISFFLVAINTVLAPKFAALHKRGETQKIALLARRFALLVTAVASPIFLISIFEGNLVMSVFGNEFANAGIILAILASGQMVNAFTGPVGVILMMGGREDDMRTLSLISIAAVIMLAIFLIPNNGALGAALATSSGYVLTSVLSVAMVRLRFGIWAVPFLPSAAKVIVRTHKDDL